MAAYHINLYVLRDRLHYWFYFKFKFWYPLIQWWVTCISRQKFSKKRAVPGCVRILKSKCAVAQKRLTTSGLIWSVLPFTIPAVQHFLSFNFHVLCHILTKNFFLKNWFIRSSNSWFIHTCFMHSNCFKN